MKDNPGVLDWARSIKALGFKVYLAERGTYGFISDHEGTRVLSFSFNDGGSLHGNYGPPSYESGTGWRLYTTPWDMKTAEDVKAMLFATPPQYCGRGWKRFTTLNEHLLMYGKSSRYEEI
jgi:hypothetical protein